MLTFDENEVTGPASAYDPAGDRGKAGRPGSERAMQRTGVRSALSRLLAYVASAACALLRAVGVSNAGRG